MNSTIIIFNSSPSVLRCLRFFNDAPNRAAFQSRIRRTVLSTTSWHRDVKPRLEDLNSIVQERLGSPLVVIREGAHNPSTGRRNEVFVSLTEGLFLKFTRFHLVIERGAGEG